MKRFYNEVSTSPVRLEPVEGLTQGVGFDRLSPNGDWHGIMLDTRPVRTPAKLPLLLANAAMAEAAADEWRAQGATVNPFSMPITGLANAAIDRVAPDPLGFASGIAVYAESELLCYRADKPPELVERQHDLWNPILAWARRRYDVSFTIVEGIIHQAQPPATLKRLGEAVAAYPPFALAALSPITTIAGSLVIALAFAERELETDAAFDAAHLDELWQEEQWGADDFALEARAVRRADFNAACRFLHLLDG
jgi:chaperone required for assembly of F1-ATPase